MEVQEDPEIPVWYRGSQKWITGVTRRTTCDDVIYALVSQRRSSSRPVNLSEFEVWERWRGVDRPLRGRTKILKLWRTWGTMADSVILYVKRVDTRCDSGSELAPSNKPLKRHRQREGSGKLSYEDRVHEREKRYQKQKQLKKTLKADQHLHKACTKESEDKLAYKQLLAQIQEGEQIIAEQLQRIKELDIQIETYETRIHQLRISKNGTNYLQEMYMKDKSDESTSTSTTSSSNDDYLISEHTTKLQLFLNLCEGIADMQDKIDHETSCIDDLSQSILQESVNINDEEGSEFRKDVHPTEDIKDVHGLREEIRKATDLNQVQEYQLKVLDNTIQECDSQISERRDYIEHLTFAVDQKVVEVEESDSSETHTGLPQVQDKKDIELKGRHHDALAQGHCGNNSSSVSNGILGTRDKAERLQPYLTYVKVVRRRDDFVGNERTKADDTSSDTGLSSMHSDESPTILETLV